MDRCGRPGSGALNRLGPVVKAVLPVVGLAIAVGVLLLLVDVRAAAGALVSADPWWLLLAAAMAFNVTFVVAAKLWAVVRIVDMPRTFRQTWFAVMAGLALNAILPARGGDIARAVFLSEEEGSLSVLLGAVLVERLIDIGALGILVVLTGFGLNWTTAMGVGVLGLAVVAAMGLAFLGPRSPIRPDLGERVARTATMAGQRPGWVAAVGGLSMVAWTNNALLMVCCLRAVGVEFAVLQGVQASIISILAGIVPVSISGIGTRDATLVLLLDSIGQTDSVAAGGLLFTILAYWFLGVVGAVVLGPEALRTIRSRLKQKPALSAPNGDHTDSLTQP